MPPIRKQQPIMFAPDTLERIRDAAFWADGETISSIAERGALLYIAQLEAERGSPFPPREGDVRTGRPRSKRL